MNCNRNEEMERIALFIQNQYKQVGGAVNIDCLYNIAALLVLMSNSYSLITTNKLMHSLQSESFFIQIFRTEIKKFANCIAFLSSEEKLSFSMEGLEKIVQDNSDGDSSKAALF